METDLEIANRWRYLRKVLQEQLAQFEAGALQLHSGTENISKAAIDHLRKEIDDFDGMIRMSEKRAARRPK